MGNLFTTKAELIAQARELRQGSSNLSGVKLEKAQAEHKRIMQRISQINEYLRNN
jgi:hypothetical protein